MFSSICLYKSFFYIMGDVDRIHKITLIPSSIVFICSAQVIGMALYCNFGRTDAKGSYVQDLQNLLVKNI